MPDDHDPYDQRQQARMDQKHLSQVRDIEEGADTDGVQPVLGLERDPLRVEVGLHQVAGEGRAERGQEADHARHPSQRSTATPSGHPELPPQVDDHEDEEQLHAPEVQAVDEPAR